jgi:hypothetical protein
MKLLQSKPDGSSAEPDKLIWAFTSELASNKVTCIKLARVQVTLLNRSANRLFFKSEIPNTYNETSEQLRAIGASSRFDGFDGWGVLAHSSP